MKRLFIAAMMAALASSAVRAADCSGTIGTGGTAQTAIATPAGGQRINGYRVCNLSPSRLALTSALRSAAPLSRRLRHPQDHVAIPLAGSPARSPVACVPRPAA